MLGVSGPFHSMLNKGIGLYDPQESFQLCCSKVVGGKAHGVVGGPLGHTEWIYHIGQRSRAGE